MATPVVWDPTPSLDDSDFASLTNALTVASGAQQISMWM